MRGTLVTVALTLLAVVVIADLGDEVDVGWGYFLVVSALVLAAAVWKPSPLEGSVTRRVYDIYEALSGEPLSVEELLQKVTGGNVEYDAANGYRSTIARMIMDGNLVIADGKVEVARQD